MTDDTGHTPPTGLLIQPVTGEDMLQEWRHVHNVIVPPAAMTPDQARQRLTRYRLANAYLDGVLVGCSTVRPPQDGTATVIARVLPAHRRQGIGTALYQDGLGHARVLGARTVETCVLAANTDGLQFARARGFTETDRYVLDGESDLWIDLRLTSPT
ncbi:GNAT family N-acetyltransferase [Streptomyces sp. Ru71]|uniref:GNAT family N-acetyltransferase n=1 Tax=Streptomyces sp. Ru71 TaxID=2080746 RepID=UPI000CDE1373|nr:GNAT family N-acetyltransferase [Streptomyces sp. Ru71]POX45086.1 GNAT family N-acetyltransferase [Streptomyces sp. Ru71]